MQKYTLDIDGSDIGIIQDEKGNDVVNLDRVAWNPEDAAFGTENHGGFRLSDEDYKALLVQLAAFLDTTLI